MRNLSNHTNTEQFRFLDLPTIFGEAAIKIITSTLNSPNVSAIVIPYTAIDPDFFKRSKKKQYSPEESRVITGNNKMVDLSGKELKPEVIIKTYGHDFNNFRSFASQFGSNTAELTTNSHSSHPHVDYTECHKKHEIFNRHNLMTSTRIPHTVTMTLSIVGPGSALYETSHDDLESTTINDKDNIYFYGDLGADLSDRRYDVPTRHIAIFKSGFWTGDHIPPIHGSPPEFKSVDDASCRVTFISLVAGAGHTAPDAHMSKQKPLIA